MSKPNKIILKRSLIALAVASLSACSTTSPVANFELKQIGASIVTASKTTADLSKRTWSRTSYLLGFTDVEPAEQNTPQLMDEVDLALLEEDAERPDDVVIRPVIMELATPARQNAEENLADSQSARIIIPDADPQDAEPQDVDALSAGSRADVALSESNLIEDLVHEVSADETLWEIAKLTTGDANNWHSIADLNDLAPNAAVFPGQQLIIPGNLVKAEFSTPADSSDEVLVTDAVIVTQVSQVSQVSQQDSVDSIDDNTVLAAANPDSTAMETESAVTAVAISNSEAFELNTGETLWDFAKRITGDATNWKAIAEQNNFSEKQATLVHPGQKIYIPLDLIKPDVAMAADTEQPIIATEPVATAALPATSETESEPGEQPIVNVKTEADDMPTDDTLAADAAVKVSEKVSESVDTVGALLAEAAGSTPESVHEKPMKIVEAAYKSDDVEQALSITTKTDIELDQNTPIPEEIMVSGTYYPKAVYNNADFSSSLLMRVSPGTKLRVANAVGTWYEVETEKGRGFVHQRDIK